MTARIYERVCQICGGKFLGKGRRLICLRPACTDLRNSRYQAAYYSRTADLYRERRRAASRHWMERKRTGGQQVRRMLVDAAAVRAFLALPEFAGMSITAIWRKCKAEGIRTPCSIATAYRLTQSET